MGTYDDWKAREPEGYVQPCEHGNDPERCRKCDDSAELRDCVWCETTFQDSSESDLCPSCRKNLNRMNL